MARDWAAGRLNGITRTASDGVEQTVYLPVTDQEGWGDGNGNSIILGEDEHAFLYTATVEFTQNGRTIGGKPQSKPIAVPAGDGTPLDLDKLIPLTSPRSSRPTSSTSSDTT